jgi:hypothetical protein
MAVPHDPWPHRYGSVFFLHGFCLCSIGMGQSNAVLQKLERLESCGPMV